MSITQTVYAKARSEIIALFGFADTLSPDQTLRVDCAVALRLALDDLQGRIVRGESIDVAKMLTASEALAKLLPPTVLASPPPEHRDDPREALLQMIMQGRKRGEDVFEGYDGKVKQVEALQAEVAALKAEIASWDGSRPSADSTPTLAEPSPQPASEKPRSQAAGGKVVDLRASRANGAGGSAGFRVGPADEPWRTY